LAQVAYSEALMQQAASDSALVEAEAAWQAVSGVRLGAKRVDGTSLLGQWPRPPTGVDEALLPSLPTLAILRSRIKVANIRVRLLQEEGLVNPAISLRAGREGVHNVLGLSVEVPLLVGQNFNAGVRAARYESVAEEQLYQAARRRAKARLEGSLGQFQHTLRAWQAWVNSGQQAHREQRGLLEQLWQAGELTATDFLVQTKQHIDTQVAATTLRGNVWQAAIEWLDASAQVTHWLGMAPDVSADINDEGE
jgi:cobalt-zinc-cadmium efflux system outer membrane protein